MRRSATRGRMLALVAAALDQQSTASAQRDRIADQQRTTPAELAPLIGNPSAPVSP